MNTIKIYLAESGRIADLHKDFPLYQYQYQNKLLNVFVPTSILAPQFTTLSDEGQTLSEYVAGTAVKIGMTYLTRSGEIKVSQSSYLRYLKTLTYQNVEYALFERKLPKEFTLYAGQGQNAPTLVINVVNIETDVEPAETLSIIPSQTCSLDVMPSTNLDNDEPIEPSELETINGRLNAIDEKLTEKQDKVDESIQLTTDSDDNPTWQDSQSVVGAINNNTAQNELNKTNIAQNTSDIAQNTSDIAYLYNHIAQPEEYIGQMTGSSLPTNAQLTQFVENTVGREPKNADVVIFILEVAGETDKNYKYTYSIDGWNGYEIPPIENAGNGSLGLIEGTYNIGDTNNTLVDIVSGKIVNIYIKDTTSQYRNIVEYANSTHTTVQSIISGSQSVGKALQAISDGVGNNIVNTYLTQNAGATKQYVRDYSLPREFNDVYFISADGYSTTVPTTPASGIQFSIETNSVGDHQIFQITKQETADYELSSKNSARTVLYVSADQNCSVYFRLTTQAQITENEWETLGVDLTEPVSLTQNNITKIEFNSPFSSLGDKVITIAPENLLRQTFEVVTETSSAITFDVYSGETYTSSFALNSQTMVQKVLSGGIGEELSISALGTAVTGGVDFAITDTSLILNNNTSAEFILEYIGEINDADVITLSLNAQDLGLTTPYGGSVLGKYLKQCYFSYNGTKTTIRFKGFINVDSGNNVSIRVEEDNLQALNEKLDKVTSTAGNKRVYSINENGTQGTIGVDYSNSATSNRIPIRSTNGAIMIPNASYDDAGAIDEGLQAVNKNKLIERTTALQGTSAPTSSTVGFVGQVYIDTANNLSYQCVAITSDGQPTPTYSYNWVKIVRETEFGIIEINNAPTTSTQADYVGQLCKVFYSATNSYCWFQCVGISGNTYTWKRLYLENSTNGIAIGNDKDLQYGGIAIGQAQAVSAGQSGRWSTAIGYGAWCGANFSTAIGGNGANCSATATNAVQLGTGQNTQPDTFQVFNYQMLDASGIIPADRLPKSSSSAYGAVKIAQGRGLDFLSDGGLFVDVAGEAQITNRTVGRPIAAAQLNFAVKSALTDTNHLTMTTAEQDTAKTVLGINYSNPNLLINGDFSINQRGEATYAGATNVYTVDRWKQYGATNSFTVATKTLTTALEFRGLIQYVENWESLKGKTITASLKATGGAGGVRLAIKADDSTDLSYIDGLVNSSGILSTTFTIPSDANYSKFQIAFFNIEAGTTTLEYAKLEVGNTATPFVPRPYAEELALCQRYCTVYNFVTYSTMVFGFARSGTNYRTIWNLPTTLRVKPTYQIKNGTLQAYINLTSYTPDSYQILSYANNIVELEYVFTNSTLTSGDIGQIVFEGGKIVFDAEIY